MSYSAVSDSMSSSMTLASASTTGYITEQKDNANIGSQQQPYDDQTQSFVGTRMCGHQSFNVASRVFSVNSNGRIGVVADAQGLCALGLLETPFPKHRIPHQSRWSVDALECCRLRAYPERVATTSRNNILIWDISAETAPLTEVIRHHQQPVTTLSWSFSSGHILASASVSPVPSCPGLPCLAL